MTGILSRGLFDSPVKRRVFFSFHYQSDIWRVNQVRNSWRFQHESAREAEGFFDASLWESSQRRDPDSLKELIRTGMENTSVTAVLVGSNTFERRWVRSEIARSIVKGNGLVGVQVHLLRDRLGNISVQGPSPFDYMGLYKAADGRVLLAEHDGEKWVAYSDYTQAITLPAKWSAPRDNTVVRLSQYAPTFCYVQNAGQSNFSSWVGNAAAAIGR